jgi:hypothetical protein
MPPAVIGMAGTFHRVHLSPLRCNHKLFSLGWPATFIIQSVFYAAWDDSCTPLLPAIGWNGVLLTFCLDFLESLFLPAFQVAGIIDCTTMPGLLFEFGSTNILLRLFFNLNPPISVSQMVGIIAVGHCAQPFASSNMW